MVAHPQKCNQIAIRMWDHDIIYVIEPSHELGGEWVCKANQRSWQTLQGIPSRRPGRSRYGSLKRFLLNRKLLKG